ncbi:hypothetical protein JCM3775_002910 [Rhodotorula graminis]
MAPITHLQTLEECNKLLASKRASLVVIDFHAAWCGPCHAIAPVFEKLAAQYPSVVFCKVDVDKAQEISRAYRVTAMPTFAFVKGERKVHEVRGANAKALEAGIKQFSADSTGTDGAFPGGGQTLAGTAIPTEVPPAERNYTKLILIFLVAAWWAYSRGQK